jgi:hypothetical protein
MGCPSFPTFARSKYCPEQLVFIWRGCRRGCSSKFGCERARLVQEPETELFVCLGTNQVYSQCARTLWQTMSASRAVRPFWTCLCTGWHWLQDTKERSSSLYCVCSLERGNTRTLTSLSVCGLILQVSGWTFVKSGIVWSTQMFFPLTNFLLVC